MAKKHNTDDSVMSSRTKKLTSTSLLLFITVIISVVMYIGTMLFLKKGFLKLQTFFNILNASTALIITPCGMNLVMVTGGTDISVGGVVALVNTNCTVYLDYQEGGVFTSPLTALGTGLAFKAVQSSLVVYLGIQPFIVSLAGMFFARDMTAIVHTAPFNVTNEAFSALKNMRINIPGLRAVSKLGKYVSAYVEIGVIVAILTAIILLCVLKWTKLGRNFYAMGGNQQSTLVLGINVKRTRFLSYLLCGLLAGIGGYVYFLHVGSGSASHASGMKMNVVASSAIRGTLLTGDVGNIFGTFVGVLSLSTVQNIVSSIGLDQAWWIEVTVAGMLCVSLVIQSVVLARKHQRWYEKSVNNRNRECREQ